MATITPEQRQEIEKAGTEPVRVEDPATGTEYVLLRADVYAKLRELMAYDHSDPSLFEYEDFRPLHEDP